MLVVERVRLVGAAVAAVAHAHPAAETGPAVVLLLALLVVVSLVALNCSYILVVAVVVLPELQPTKSGADGDGLGPRLVRVPHEVRVHLH